MPRFLEEELGVSMGMGVFSGRKEGIRPGEGEVDAGSMGGRMRAAKENGGD